MIYDGAGRKTEALAAARRACATVEKHLQLHPDDARAYCLGSAAMCLLGERTRAIEACERALNIDGDEPITLYNVGCTYAQLGRHDDAIGCLERAVEQGFTDRAWFDNDTSLNALRDDARFRALLERLK